MIFNYSLRISNGIWGFSSFSVRVACAVVAGLRLDFKKEVQNTKKPQRNEIMP